MAISSWFKQKTKDPKSVNQALIQQQFSVDPLMRVLANPNTSPEDRMIAGEALRDISMKNRIGYPELQEIVRSPRQDSTAVPQLVLDLARDNEPIVERFKEIPKYSDREKGTIDVVDTVIDRNNELLASDAKRDFGAIGKGILTGLGVIPYGVYLGGKQVVKGAKAVNDAIGNKEDKLMAIYRYLALPAMGIAESIATKGKSPGTSAMSAMSAYDSAKLNKIQTAQAELAQKEAEREYTKKEKADVALNTYQDALKKLLDKQDEYSNATSNVEDQEVLETDLGKDPSTGLPKVYGKTSNISPEELIRKKDVIAKRLGITKPIEKEIEKLSSDYLRATSPLEYAKSISKLTPIKGGKTLSYKDRLLNEYDLVDTSDERKKEIVTLLKLNKDPMYEDKVDMDNIKFEYKKEQDKLKAESPQQWEANEIGFIKRQEAANIIMKEFENTGIKPSTEYYTTELVGTGPLGAIYKIVVKSDLTSNEKSYANAMLDFVTAQLRKESGASIAPSEFESAYQIYSLRPNDDKNTISEKQSRRNSLISTKKSTLSEPIRLKYGFSSLPLEISNKETKSKAGTKSKSKSGIVLE